MDQAPPEKDVADAIPKPRVQTSKRLSIIWLVPLVALLIGGWLVVKTIRETGPTITIVFNSAEGLIPGKTEIKYKDVSVGKVRRIQLSDDLSQVLVTAEMAREMASHLTEEALFWVVRARVAAKEVSGIGTLLSGAYIGMLPGKQGDMMYRFVGREKPPAVMRDTPGRQFTLQSDTLGSLDIGSPVYYRQVNVGRVSDVDMADDGTSVMIEIFVEAPYHKQVKRTSRFFNASGLDMKISADGVRLDTPSLASLLVGGISFFTQPGLKAIEPVAQNHVFTLYDNRDQAEAASYSYREYYLLHFNETVRGLSPGSPVEFHGIHIGEVISVRLLFDQDNLSFRIPVLIAIEPDRIEFTGVLATPEYKVIEKLVEKGLRAQQRTGNLITGQSYVDISLHADAPYKAIDYSGTYPVLPTIPNTVEAITATAKRLLVRFNNLALEETLQDIRDAAQQVEAMTDSASLESAIDHIDQSFSEFKKIADGFNTDTLPRVNAMLDRAKAVLARGEEAMTTANTVLGEGTPVVYNLNRLLIDLQETARAVEALADYLERHPDAIVFGKGNLE